MPVVGKAWSKQLDRAQMTQSRHSPEALVWGQGRWSGMTLKRASVQFPNQNEFREENDHSLQGYQGELLGITEKQSWIKHVR